MPSLSVSIIFVSHFSNYVHTTHAVSRLSVSGWTLNCHIACVQRSLSLIPIQRTQTVISNIKGELCVNTSYTICAENPKPEIPFNVCLGIGSFVRRLDGVIRHTTTRRHCYYFKSFDFDRKVLESFSMHKSMRVLLRCVYYSVSWESDFIWSCRSRNMIFTNNSNSNNSQCVGRMRESCEHMAAMRWWWSRWRWYTAYNNKCRMSPSII